MRLTWLPNGWRDSLYWQENDKKILPRVNEVIKDTLRNPFSGIGKPEPLKHLAPGAWSRRLTEEHRIVYLVRSDRIDFLQARYHY